MPLSSNGPAYRRTEQREGVSLDYVAEKLRAALCALHAHVRHEFGADERSNIDRESSVALPHALHEAFQKALVAFLALRNMLGAAGDHHLTRRLVAKNADAFALWTDAVERGGSVTGIQL